MYSFIASVLLVSSLFTPHVAKAATDSTTRNLSDIREDVMDRREEVRDRVETRRAEIAENMEVRRSEFQVRVSEIRDANRQRLILKLAERFNNVNEKWTSHWTRVLNRFSEILTKMEERVAHIADQTDKDTSAVLAAIADAKDAIASAQDAVNAQAAKVYVPEIDDETSIGQNMHTLIEEFHTDLKAVLAEVQTARRSMTNALSSLKTMAGSDGGSTGNEEVDQNATESGVENGE